MNPIKNRFISLLQHVHFMKSTFLLLLFVKITHNIFWVSFWIEFYIVVHMLNLGVDVTLLLVFLYSQFCDFGVWSVKILVSGIFTDDFVFFCTLFASLSQVWISWVKWIHFLNWSFRLISHELNLGSISRFLSQIIELRVNWLSTQYCIPKVMAKSDTTKLWWLASPQFFATPDCLIFKNRLSRFNFSHS
jgi:hypothetical protein